MKSLSQKLTLAVASLLLTTSASAAIGTASAADVTLDGSPADAFAYQAGWNPHSGPNGDTSGFGTAFDAFGTGSWTLLDNPAFSNLTLFAREVVTPVPEPATYSLLLAGLGVMGVINRRRKQA